MAIWEKWLGAEEIGKQVAWLEEEMEERDRSREDLARDVVLLEAILRRLALDLLQPGDNWDRAAASAAQVAGQRYVTWEWDRRPWREE